MSSPSSNNPPASVPVALNAFSASLHLLRNYRLVVKPSSSSDKEVLNESLSEKSVFDGTSSRRHCYYSMPLAANYIPPAAAAAAQQHSNLFSSYHSIISPSTFNPIYWNDGTAICRRHSRGEKKPIPDMLKDDKYFERRRRNNQAAKKSRDARKLKEDQIAFRATMLEHENAILRAQILTLREETSSLRQMLFNHNQNKRILITNDN